MLPGHGRSQSDPGTCWSSRSRRAATALTPPPTGTSWSETSRRSRRSRPLWRRSSQRVGHCPHRVDGPEHQVELTGPGVLDVEWLHRTGSPDDADLLPAAVRGLVFPRGRVHAFVHGEADEIRVLRRHLLVDRGLTRSDMSCSPYWRREMTDEAWRAIKRDYVAAMDSDVA